MSATGRNLRILNQSSATRELDLATELFHRINRLIPEDQVPLTVAPHERVRDVVKKMRQHGYSQVPVVERGQVLGVFSYRSFAHEVAAATLDEMNKQRSAPGDLRVDECLEQFEFARVTEEMTRVFEAIDRDNGILVGAPDRLIGVLTPMDFLRYLYSVATPFVLISEIELALRAVIRMALTEEQVATVAPKLLASPHAASKRVPTRLEDMTFDNYRILITHGDTWGRFEPLLGGIASRVNAKLMTIGAIRNAVFHFRPDSSVEDHEALSGYRNWLLSKIRLADMPRSPEVQS